MGDRSALDHEKSESLAVLSSIAASYEGGFQEVGVMEPSISIPLASSDREPPEAPILVGENFQVWGNGATAAEAVADWNDRLSKVKRQTGKTLLWRIRPEIDWSLDFRAKKPLWCVYARWVVFQ